MFVGWKVLGSPKVCSKLSWPRNLRLHGLRKYLPVSLSASGCKEERAEGIHPTESPSEKMYASTVPVLTWSLWFKFQEDSYLVNCWGPVWTWAYTEDGENSATSSMCTSKEQHLPAHLTPSFGSCSTNLSSGISLCVRKRQKFF